MKRKLWINHLIGAVFAFLLSVSAVGNLQTGFSLPVDSMGLLFLWCGIFAVCSSVLLGLRDGGKILVCLSVLTLLILVTKSTLWNQTQALSYLLSSHYHDIYTWPVLGSLKADTVTLPLTVLAAWAAFGVNWYICRHKHIISALFPVLLPLVLCLITTDTVPDSVYLYILILCIALLLITDWTRRKSPAQSQRLTFQMALPIAVALAILFWMNPRQGYVNRAGDLQQKIVSWFQQLQGPTGPIGIGGFTDTATSQKIDLQTVGPKNSLSYSVMRVNTPIGGKLYLRGRDYDNYTGTGWVSSLGRTEIFASGGVSAGTLRIVTYGVRDLRYVPYNATDEIYLTDGVLDNDPSKKSYSYQIAHTNAYRLPTPDSRYTQLPEGTRQWAAALLSEVLSGSPDLETAVGQIRNYVSNTATYSLGTARMPNTHTDFAQWFLEDSDTGYCVHFATAATVLLRAAGIPARYVEGYMVSCPAGQDVVVSNQDAHAWVEYYDPATAVWRVLEATPADWLASRYPEIPTSTPPETTQPDTSQPGSVDPTDGTTRPDSTQATEDAPELPPDSSPGNGTDRKPFRLPGWLKICLWVLLGAMCVPLQGLLRIAWKRKQWHSGKPNEKALTRWRQTRQMARLLKQPFPEALDDLAQKAKFSQHRIQPGELQQFTNYRQMLIKAMAAKPWYQKCLLCWIYGIG